MDLIKYKAQPKECVPKCGQYRDCAKLCRYTNADYLKVCQTGHIDRGCPECCDIYINIQPASSDDGGEVTRKDKFGEWLESAYVFSYNPHDPRNMACNDGKPLYLRQSDSRFVSGDFDANVDGGHSDVIEWMGQKFIIRKLENWPATLCSCGQCGLISRQDGIMRLWKPKHQKRQATIDKDEFLCP